MGEIRSSWEIAQEKADKLGDLSSKERREKQEEEYRHMAGALVYQYLSDGDIRPLKKELRKYTGEDKVLMKRMILDRLIGAIDLNEGLSTEVIYRAITVLSEEAEASRSLTEIKALVNECREARETIKLNAARTGKDLLATMGISGSAVSGVNVYARDEWLNAINDVTVTFKKRLESLKNEIFLLL